MEPAAPRACRYVWCLLPTHPSPPFFCHLHLLVLIHSSAPVRRVTGKQCLGLSSQKGRGGGGKKTNQKILRPASVRRSVPATRVEPHNVLSAAAACRKKQVQHSIAQRLSRIALARYRDDTAGLGDVQNKDTTDGFGRMLCQSTRVTSRHLGALAPGPGGRGGNTRLCWPTASGAAMISVQGRTIARKNIHTAGREVDGLAKGSPPAVACMGGNSELLATPSCRIRLRREDLQGVRKTDPRVIWERVGLRSAQG